MPSDGVAGTRAKQPKCTALRSDGLPCGSFAVRGSERCLAHDPDQTEAATAARSKGATAANKRTRASTPEQLARLNEMVVLGVLAGKIRRTPRRHFSEGAAVQLRLARTRFWCDGSKRSSGVRKSRTTSDDWRWRERQALV